MRLKILLRTERKGIRFPFNYKHQLSTVLYKIIGNADRGYSQFLHNHGFLHDSKKHFKLCTNSDLLFRSYRVDGHWLVINGDEVVWYISSPIHHSLDYALHGAAQNGYLYLNIGRREYCFYIEGFELFDPVEFAEEERFTCLSPIFVSVPQPKQNGEGTKHREVDYFSEYERFCEVLKNNLLTKYELLSGSRLGDDVPFSFAFDEDYISKRNGKISNLIRFKSGTPVSRYWRAPFTIKTVSELIRVGYECGFGSRNISGFGMVERVK